MTPAKPNSSLLAAFFALLTSFSLMRQLARNGWWTALARIGKGAWIVTDPRTCVRVAKVFMSPETWPVVQSEPRVMFKYLGNYVGFGLSRKERASILIDHYAFLRARVNQNFFRTIVDGR